MATKKEILRQALLALTNDNYFAVETFSESVQVRVLAKEMNVAIKVSNINGVYVVTQKKSKETETVDLLPLPKRTACGEKPMDLKDLRAVEYAEAPKHWESRKTPVGTSGVAITGLAYKPEGWEEIPEDWLVYNRSFAMVFKPKYVANPAILTNSLTRSMGRKDLNIYLNEKYVPVDTEEALFREQTLNKRW